LSARRRLGKIFNACKQQQGDSKNAKTVTTTTKEGECGGVAGDSDKRQITHTWNCLNMTCDKRRRAGKLTRGKATSRRESVKNAWGGKHDTYSAKNLSTSLKKFDLKIYAISDKI